MGQLPIQAKIPEKQLELHDLVTSAGSSSSCEPQK